MPLEVSKMKYFSFTCPNLHLQHTLKTGWDGMYLWNNHRRSSVQVRIWNNSFGTLRQDRRLKDSGIGIDQQRTVLPSRSRHRKLWTKECAWKSCELHIDLRTAAEPPAWATSCSHCFRHSLHHALHRSPDLFTKKCSCPVYKMSIVQVSGGYCISITRVLCRYQSNRACCNLAWTPCVPCEWGALYIWVETHLTGYLGQHLGPRI